MYLGIFDSIRRAPQRPVTIAARIAATGGRPTGFDYLRILLAVSIVAWHTVGSVYGRQAAVNAWTSGWRPLLGLLLPMFFALSGFLVAGSLTRAPQLTKFLGLRALRIYPALIADTLVSALLLGPALTTLPLKAYFSAREFQHYLLNGLGLIHFTLPGLFAANPTPHMVNEQLWTVPFELQCYALLSVLAFLGLFRRRYALLVLSVLLQAASAVGAALAAHGHFVVSPAPVQGGGLVMVFLSGVTLFALREKIILNVWIFLAAVGVAWIGFSTPLGEYFIAYPVAYITVYIGFLNPRANLLHKLGDLSYGVYLYGFPLQQLVASFGGVARHWYVSFPLSLSLAIGMAAISWNVVEKPALSLKQHLKLLSPIDSALGRVQGAVRSGGAYLLGGYQKLARAT